MFLDCRCWVKSQRFNSSIKHRGKMRPTGDWMDSFQTDSKIGFQFIPSEKRSPVANYSHCQLTSQPALSEGLDESACQIYSFPSRQSRWWKQTGNFCGATKISACNSQQLRQGLVRVLSEGGFDDMCLHPNKTIPTHWVNSCSTASISCWLIFFYIKKNIIINI